MRNNYAVIVQQTGETLKLCPTYRQAAHYVTSVNRAGFLTKGKTLEVQPTTYDQGTNR